MLGSSSGQVSEARGPGGRNSYVDAELLAPPEADPVQLSRDMFVQPAPRPPPAPLTNQHLKKVARMDGGASGSGASRASGASGAAGAGHRDRAARSVAASSVRGGKAAFSIVSDEEAIDVDGEPTTLADDDLDLPPPSPGSPYDNGDPRVVGRGLGHSGIAGLGPGGGMPDPLEEMEADTPQVRLIEAHADLEAESQGNKDPWVMVPLAQMVLAQAKVVWRTMPVVVREEPLLLARAHFSLARAYQALGGCDRQASDHGKQALAAIPRDVADTEGARALRTEVQVMRAEALLSSAEVPGLPADAACNQARKALALLVKAGGLTEPIAWTQDEVDENELSGHVQRATIDRVSDMGIVALMAQCHGVVAEARLKTAEAAEGEKRSSLRSAAEAAARLDKKTERGDAFYSAEQMDKYRSQEEHFRDEADNHQAESLRLAAEAERAFDAAMYCLNAVIDQEGNRLEGELGREGKLSHPTFQALWRRSLDFMAGIANAYGLQRKDSMRLAILDEVMAAFVQYGSGGWMPVARHIQALKDKGTLLVDKRDYEGAMSCYETLTDVVSELFAEDVVRKDLQVAESLKLRGDVALAAGDFRTAQHMFNQALELYQRHLGPNAPVAQDLLHRIDEVKSYLSDARVMGRMASFPGRASQTVAASVLAHSVSGSGAGSAATTPKSGSMASRASAGGRPPPLPLSNGPASTRPSSGLATPLNPDTPGSHIGSRSSVASGSARQSFDGMHSVSGGGGGDHMSIASGLQPRQSTASSFGLPALSGSRRPSYGSGAPLGRTSGGGSILDTAAAAAAAAADGEGGDGTPNVAASIASYRSGSMSRRSFGGGESAGGAGEGGPGSPSVHSHRSGDLGGVSGGGNWMSGGLSGLGGAASHHSGDLNGSPSATSLSQRNRTSGGFGAGGFGTYGSGGGAGDVGGGAASHHSGELNAQASAASLSRRSNASGFAAAGFGTGGGAGGDAGGVSGSGWPGTTGPASHHSGEFGGGGSHGGGSVAGSMSRRSNASGLGLGGGGGADGGGFPAPAAQNSGELGGSPSATSLSHRSHAGAFGFGTAAGAGGGDDDAAGGDGGFGGGFGTASPKVPASHHSGELNAQGSATSLGRRSHASGLGGAAAAGGEGGGSGWPGSGVGGGSGSRRASGADYGWGAGSTAAAPAAAASPAASVAASRRMSNDLFGAGAAGGGAGAGGSGSQAGSVAASRRFSGDLLGGFGAGGDRPGTPAGASVKSGASRGLAGGNSGDFGAGGDAAEPARPGSPSAMSTKSVARSAYGGGGGGGNFGASGFGAERPASPSAAFGADPAPPRPGSPSGASNKSFGRAGSGYGLGNSGDLGGAAAAAATGGEPERPGSPSAMSTKSAARSTAGFGGFGGGNNNTSGDFGAGGGGFGVDRRGSASGASNKSFSRVGGGAGGSGGFGGNNSGDFGAGGGGGGFGAERPASPSAASNKSFSRGGAGADAGAGGGGGFGATSGEIGGARGDSFSRGRSNDNNNDNKWQSYY